MVSSITTLKLAALAYGRLFQKEFEVSAHERAYLILVAHRVDTWSKEGEKETEGGLIYW